MFNVAIYSKTAKGRQEIAERRIGLSPKLRQALILVDGHSSFGLLRVMFAQLGDPIDIIQRLSDLGLVESDYDLPPMPEFGVMAQDSGQKQYHSTN